MTSYKAYIIEAIFPISAATPEVPESGIFASKSSNILADYFSLDYELFSSEVFSNISAYSLYSWSVPHVIGSYVSSDSYYPDSLHELYIFLSIYLRGPEHYPVTSLEHMCYSAPLRDNLPQHSDSAFI